MARLVFWWCVLAVVLIAIFYPVVIQVAVVGIAAVGFIGDVLLRLGTRAIDRWRKF